MDAMNPGARTVAVIVVCLVAPALNSQLSPQPSETSSPGDTVLHIHVNSVLVPVVVRDAQGRAVGNLKQEEFKIFDQGKRRSIVGFTIQGPETTEGEQPAVRGSASETSTTASGG